MKNTLEDARKTISEVDGEIARLFEKRMRAVRAVAEYKKENGMPIFDAAREDEVVRRGKEMISDEAIREHYADFIKATMRISKRYQRDLIGEATGVELGERRYDVTVGRGLLCRAGEIFNLRRRVFIVTDEGVPREYSERVAEACEVAKIVTVKSGEGAKSIEVYAELMQEMLKFGMTRSDCAVAVGGGVVGDLVGFLSASYMRGIDFYNVPTTLLAMVDSSVGGKCAINFGGIKNVVGAFHQPRGVLIDPDVVGTLSKRHISNGLAEVLKMALTCDAELFSMLEGEEIGAENIEEIISRSLRIKASVVECDERESGVRRVLNFGHTLGHAIEAVEGLSGLLHGECVGLGILAVITPKIREKVVPVLKKLGLPTSWGGDTEAAISFISHDKKCDGGMISAVLVSEIGSYEIKKMTVGEFADRVRNTPLK